MIWANKYGKLFRLDLIGTGRNEGGKEMKNETKIYVIYRCDKCHLGEIKLNTDPSLDGKKCRREDGCSGTMKKVREIPEIISD